MFGKSFVVLLLLGAAGAYFAGAFSPGYSRDIEQPIPLVLTALQSADIRNQPGSPGTDSDLAGGVTPGFKTETTADGIVWTVTSGDKTAVTMTAKLSPIHDGAGTHVIATVERGDAPDDLVSPAFRSHGVTMGLFASMIESRLNQLTAWSSGRAGAPGGGRTMADGIRNVMRVNAAYGEYLRTGQDPFADVHNNEFHDVESHMQPASEKPRQDGVTFEPGKPMIDVSHYNRSGGR